MTRRSLTLMYDGEAVRHTGFVISLKPVRSARHFPGARPELPRRRRSGRRPGTIILSDAVWRVRHHADPSVIGRTVMVNDAPHTVIGVMPPRFAFPVNTEAWIPLDPIAHADARSARGLRVYARLAPAASLDTARDELRALALRLASQHLDKCAWRSAPARPTWSG